MAPVTLSRPRRTVRIVLGLLTAAALMASGSAGYTVRAGDTLWDIAARLGVSASSLASANGIANPDLIRPGRQLSLPGGGAASTAGGGGTHVVRAGETLLDISIRTGVKMRDIAAANGLSDLNRVYAGQRLRIAGAGTAAAPAPAAAPSAPAASTGAPWMPASRAEVGRMLERTAGQYGFNPAFVKALAYQESGWNQAARSSAGAVGVMQVLPSTGEFVSTHIVGRPLDLTDTQDNITAGVAFLSYLWRLTGGDTDRTMAGYYQGLRSVQVNGMYPSTRQYIRNVKALRARY